MKKNNLWMPLLYLLITLSGCRDKNQITHWLNSTHDAQTEALKQSGADHYQNEQHQAFKAYFAELISKAAEIKDDPANALALNTALSKLELKQVCSDILISKEKWIEINEKCTKNRFYLCADEVSAYPIALETILGQLSKDLQKKFHETESCQNAIQLSPETSPDK